MFHASCSHSLCTIHSLLAKYRSTESQANLRGALRGHGEGEGEHRDREARGLAWACALWLATENPDCRQKHAACCLRGRACADLRRSALPRSAQHVNAVLASTNVEIAFLGIYVSGRCKLQGGVGNATSCIAPSAGALRSDARHRRSFAPTRIPRSAIVFDLRSFPILSMFPPDWNTE